jgi:hypothetical protein
MAINSVHVFDFSRGVDVFRGSKLLKHFDGPNAYEAARLFEAAAPGRYLRYWRAKPVVVTVSEGK